MTTGHKDGYEIRAAIGEKFGKTMESITGFYEENTPAGMRAAKETLEFFHDLESNLERFMDVLEETIEEEMDAVREANKTAVEDVIAVLQNLIDRVPDAKLRTSLSQLADELKHPNFDRQSLQLIAAINTA